MTMFKKSVFLSVAIGLVLGAGGVPAAAQTSKGNASTSTHPAPSGMSSYLRPNDNFRPDYGPPITTPNHFPLHLRDSPHALYARALRFAECASGDEHVEMILRTSMGSQDEARELERFYRSKPRCRMDAERLSPLLVRAALAEISVLRKTEHPDRDMNGARLTPGLNWRHVTPKIDDNAPPALFAATNTAVCQVNAVPASARMVLSTTPGSSDEKRAEAALFAAAPACAGAERPETYTPVVYRALLASIMGNALLDERKRRS